MVTKKASTRKRVVGKKSAFNNARMKNVSSKEVLDRLINKSYKKLSYWYEKPSSKYVAAGIGMALFVPIGVMIYRRYPRFKYFVRRQLDNLEESLKTYHLGQNEDPVKEPHH